MKQRKGFTLIEVIMIGFYLVMIVMLILPIILSAPGDSGFRKIIAELPVDFKETISIQRDYFECHLSYVDLNGNIKVRRYWFWGMWAPDIDWIGNRGLGASINGAPDK